MKRKHRLFLRLHLVTLFFISVSMITITLAWFAYSGLASVSTEIGIKAWYIEFSKDNQVTSNDIVVSLSEIYPGMDTTIEQVDIKNLGDSIAQLKYEVDSIRILDQVYDMGDTYSTEYLEDKISHEFPFHININLDKDYILPHQDDESSFKFTISWPLDSDSDELDSVWGNEAYRFQMNEITKKNADSSYQIKPAIELTVSVIAEQYIESLESTDTRFNIGDIVLYDIMENKRCDVISPTCLKTYVFKKNSLLGDTTIELLPDVYNTYVSGKFNDYDSLYNLLVSPWNAATRKLTLSDVVEVISSDIEDTVLVRDKKSDTILGKVNYPGRIESELNRIIPYNGYYSYRSYKFTYLSSSKCYWLSDSYDSDKGFAFVKYNDYASKLYGEDNNSICNVVPIIVASKSSIDV